MQLLLLIYGLTMIYCVKYQRKESIVQYSIVSPCIQLKIVEVDVHDSKDRITSSIIIGKAMNFNDP